MHSKISFVCPVCGYPELTEPPYDQHLCASFDICASCGTEFGLDDASRTHEELRKDWIDAGTPWYSKALKPPSDWMAEVQMQAAGFFNN